MLKTLKDLEHRRLVVNAAELQAVARRFAIGVTPEVLGAIKTPDDPVARQYIPDPGELTSLPDEDHDPVGDTPHEVTKGLIHRYRDRVLFKITPTCAVYCRFCFRREMVGPGHEALGPDDMARACDYILKNPQIREVILSGGDPLILSPRRLKDIIHRLAAVPHVKLIRIHSRIPVAAPEKITPDLCQALQSSGKILTIAVHCNHPQEFTENARAAIDTLRRSGVQLLSQSVLLKGVNNTPETLEELYRGFSELGIKAYYLHHPDKAPGTSHFRVRIAEGQALMRRLRGRLSGHALPVYVLDIPGGYGKVPVTPDWIRETADGYLVTDPWGGTHFYQD